MTISSIILLVQPGWSLLILTGRAIAGVAHGIGYVTVLVHAGEVSTPKHRGTFVSTVQMSIFIGVLLLTSFNFQSVDWSRDFAALEFSIWVGIIGLTLVLFGVPLMYFFHEESPMYYIKKQQSQKAQDLMMKLRRETELTDDARLDFEDLYRLVAEDLADGSGVFEPRNLRSMIVIICLRLAVVCAFNMPVNIAWIEAASPNIREGDTDPTAFTFASIRLSALVIVLLFIDSCRRILGIVALSGTGLVMLLLTISTVVTEIGANATLMVWMAVLFHTFGAFGVGLHADIYSAESFSSIRKPFSIAITVFFECTIQSLLVLYNFYSIISSVWVFTIITCALFCCIGLVIFAVPDTARIPLIEAKNKFYRKILRD